MSSSGSLLARSCRAAFLAGFLICAAVLHAEPTASLSAERIVATVGDDVTISVISDATDPTYQWQRNGFDLVGETGPSLVLPDVDSRDADRYSALVTDGPSQSVQMTPAVRVHVFPAEIPDVIVPDSSWQVDFSGGSSSLTAVLSAPDGGILLAGDFRAVNGHGSHDIVRLTQDGEVDSGFSAPRFFPRLDVNSIKTMWPQDDDYLLAVTNPRALPGKGTGRLMRLNADGSMDPDFAMDPNLAQEHPEFSIESVEVAPDRRIYITFSHHPEAARYPVVGLARLEEDGTWDRSFVAPTLINASLRVCVLALSDGGVLVSHPGEFSDGSSVRHLFRLDGLGKIDAAFDAALVNNGLSYGYTQYLLHETAQGIFILINGMPGSSRLELLQLDGSTRQSWLIEGTTARVVELPDGNTLVGGQLGIIDGVDYGQSAIVNDLGELSQSGLSLGALKDEFECPT